MAWLKAHGKWDAPDAANIDLAVYGVLHLGLMFVILVSKGQVGIGSLLTLACFVALLVLLIKSAKGIESPEAPERLSD